MRFVISELPPGPGGAPIANWLETTGHRTGPIMLRWQQLTRSLTAADGPTVEVVPVTEVPKHLPGLVGLSTEEYADRIAARQRAVARRMIS